MAYRYLLLLLFFLPLFAFAQRQVYIGPLVAVGTGGVQEPLSVSESDAFVIGNRLSPAYKLGVAIDWRLGKGRSLTSELAWQMADTKSVQRFFSAREPQDFRRFVEQIRFTGGQVNLLFRQRLVTERTVNPVLEVGLGGYFPHRMRRRQRSERDSWRPWFVDSGELLRTVQLQGMIGFGVQWNDRISTTLRFTVPFGDLFNEEEFNVICIQRCFPPPSAERFGIGLNTQLLQTTFLF